MRDYKKIEFPGMYFKGEQLAKIIAIKEKVLVKCREKLETTETIPSIYITNIKKFANKLLKENGLEKDLFNEFICRYRTKFIDKVNEPTQRPELEINSSGVAYTPLQINSYGNNNYNPKNILLVYAGVIVQSSIFGLGYGYGLDEMKLNELINDDKMTSNIIFKKETENKFKKEKIYFCKAMNKNVNLVITYREFSKALWDDAPDGVLNSVIIPLVMNGDIVKATMYETDLTSNYNIDGLWINNLLEKLKEWFEVDIKLI